MSKRSLFLITLLTFGLLVSGLSISRTALADKLVLLQPTPKRYAGPYIDQFKQWYEEKTGNSIAVERVRMGGIKAVKRVKAQGGRPRSDVLMSVGYGSITELAPDLLMPYKSPNLSSYPEEIAGQPAYSPEGYFTGISFSAVGILYNTDVLEERGLPKPDSYSDLADYKTYKGYLVMGNPAATAIAHRNVQAILQAYGWEEGWRKLMDIAVAMDKFTSSTGKATTLTAKGEYLAVLTKNAYFNEFKSKGFSVDFAYPEEGTYPSIVYAGILKGARHEEEAKAWMDWVTSKPGQSKWAKLRYTTAVRKDAKMPAGVPSLGEVLEEIKAIEGFSLEEIKNRSDTVTKLFAENIIGYQARLRELAEDGNIERIEELYEQWIIQPREKASERIETTKQLISQAEEKDLTEQGKNNLGKAKELLEEAQYHLEVTFNREGAVRLGGEAVDKARLALAQTK